MAPLAFINSATEAQQDEYESGRQSDQGRGEHRIGNGLALQNVPAMHQMMRAAACSHQREADAKPGPAAVAVQTDGFPRRQRAKARISEPDHQTTDANDQGHHGVPGDLVPMGAPM